MNRSGAGQRRRRHPIARSSIDQADLRQGTSIDTRAL
jgi:hypothetical protein